MCFAAVTAHFIGRWLHHEEGTEGTHNGDGARTSVRRRSSNLVGKLTKKKAKGNAPSKAGSESEEYVSAGESNECIVCWEELDLSEAIHCQGGSRGGHFFCRACVRRHAEVAVVNMPLAAGAVGLRCMEQDCSHAIFYGHFYEIVPADVLQRLDERILEETLSGLPNVERCKNCRFPVEVEISTTVYQFLQCMKCSAEFCRICKRDLYPEHFGTSCEELDAKDAREKAAKGVQEEMSASVIRKCPSCAMSFVKQEGCNKMTCRCGKTQCYLCRAIDIDYTHYCQHFREPGKPCKKCTRQCLVWEDAEKQDDEKIQSILNRSQRV